MKDKPYYAKRRRICSAFVLIVIAVALLLAACDNKGIQSPAPSPLPTPAVVAATSPSATATPDSTSPELPTLWLRIDAAGYEELSPGSEYVLDGLLYVTLQDFPKQTDIQYDESTLLARIKALMGDDIRMESLTFDEEHSARLTYPVWRIVYQMGDEEDTSLCADIYFQTDTREYRVHTRAPIDHALGYRDELQDYDDRIAALFASIDLKSDDLFARIDPTINQAIAPINAARRDDLSPDTFGFEKRLVYDILNAEDKARYDEMVSKVRGFETFTYPADQYGYDVLDQVLRVIAICKAGLKVNPM